MDLRRFRKETLRGKDGETPTQAALGDALGVTQDQVSRWEKNPDSITVKAINLICDTFGISPNVLFDDFQPKTIEAFDLGDPLGNYELNQQMVEQYTGIQLSNLTSAPDLSPAGRVVIKTLESFKGFQHIKPIIGFVGRYDSGKSKMINSLCGSDVLPIGWSPTSAIPVLLKHIKSRPDWVEDDVLILGSPPSPHYQQLSELRYFYPNSKSEIDDILIDSGDYQLLQQYGTYQTSFTTNSKHLFAANLAIAYVDAPILKACDLLDIPGIPANSTPEELEFLRAIDMANYVIYLSKTNTFMDRVDVHVLNKLFTQFATQTKLEDHPDPLARLIIVASQAHLAKNSSNVKSQLDNGVKRLWNQLPKSMKTEEKGLSLSYKNIRARCVSYTTNDKELRAKFEQTLTSTLLDHSLPFLVNWFADYYADFKEGAHRSLTQEIEIYKVFIDGMVLGKSPHTEFLVNWNSNKKDNIDYRIWLQKEAYQHSKTVQDTFSSWWNENVNASLIVDLIKNNNYTKKEAQKLIGYSLSERLINELRLIQNTEYSIYSKDYAPFLENYRIGKRNEITSTADTIYIPDESLQFKVLSSTQVMHNLHIWGSTIESILGSDSEFENNLSKSLKGVIIKSPVGLPNEQSWQDQLADKVIQFLKQEEVLWHYNSAINDSWLHHGETLKGIEHIREKQYSLRKDLYDESSTCYDKGQLEEIVQGLNALRNIVNTITWQP
jgi:transcriptional regulator with XRE-family HTH domain